MKFEVKYDEVLKTGKYIEAKNEEIRLIFNRSQKIIDRVKDAWEGEDANVFVDKATVIIRDEQERRKKLESLGKMITIISGNYNNKDNEWNDKIKKENALNEYRN